jgi:tetratricopeptide (TPR) repeat protein
VRAGINWNTIRWSFTSLEQANWHPLTWLSHALDCQLFQLHPAGHHFTNVLLHALNVLLLFLILQWFTGYAGRSLMVAALFAVHPINVESVSWLAERKNVLCMLFFLLAVGAYGWYVRRPGTARYLCVTLLFALGLMAKPMVITLPFVLFLLDYWPIDRMNLGTWESSSDLSQRGVSSDGKRSLWWLCAEKIPLLALSAGSAVVTMMAQKAGGAVASTVVRSPLLRGENAIVSYARYLGKAIWPSGLAALYPYPNALSVWQVTLSALVLLLVSAAVLRYREHRHLLVGWPWFLGTMVPMIGLVQVGNQAMADRYAYLPFVGLFVMIVWAAGEWARRRRVATTYLAAAGLVIVIGLSTVTIIQVRHWHDDYSLWSHALAVTRGNFVAENNLGRALTNQGRVEEAIGHFRAAALIEPGDPASQINLGIYAQNHGDLKEAGLRYQRVLVLATDAELRASAYANLGTVYFAQRDYGHAKENFASAMKLGFAFPAVLLDSALIAQKEGDFTHAVDYYARFATAEPSDVAYLLLAQALERNGQHDEARVADQQARRLSIDMNQAQKMVDKVLAN